MIQYMHELAVSLWVCVFIATVTSVLSTQHGVIPSEIENCNTSCFPLTPLEEKASKVTTLSWFGRSLVSPANEKNTFNPIAESVSVSNKVLKVT